MSKKNKRKNKKLQEFKKRLPFRTKCNKIHKSKKSYDRKRDKKVNDDD